MRPCRRSVAVLTAILAGSAFAACGGGGEPEGANAKRFSGEKKRVAAVVDELEAASRDGDAKRICDDLFSDKLAGVISVRAGGTCEDQVRKRQLRKNASITVLSLRVGSAAANADVEEQNQNRTTLKLVKLDGDWRIDSITATSRPQK
jgi:hypothetical protein